MDFTRWAPQLQARSYLLTGQADGEESDAPFAPAEEWPVRAAEREIDGPHGPIRIRIYAPVIESERRSCLVWCHGGAFMRGDLDMPEAHEVAMGVAGRADAVVVSVDYRLAAPGSGIRFPQPGDDVHAAYLWVRENAAVLGVDPVRIAIGGASAGANLAAVAAMRLRHSTVSPWQVILAYPVLHPDQHAWTPDQERDFAETPERLKFTLADQIRINDAYLGPGVAPSPESFPGLAQDFSGFPPTYIENDQFDTLRASGEKFTQQLREAGVDVEEFLVEGVPHGHLNKSGLDAQRASMDAFAARLMR